MWDSWQVYLLRKHLDTIQVQGVASDRICGLQVKLSATDDSFLTILGVYMACLDQGIECYREHLVEVERLICELLKTWPCFSGGF